MSMQPTLPTTRLELLQLHMQCGTWTAVRKALALSPQQLITLRKRLDCYEPPKRNKKASVLDPYLDQIRELAAQGLPCPRIVEVLQLPVQAEQVRRQMHRHGIPVLTDHSWQRGASNHAWKGGRSISKSGYVLLYMPDHPHAKGRGYVWEHRYVMEQHLGRFLTRKEVVHHINNVKDDNRIENLLVYLTNREHLQATLKGKIPNWSADGKERMRQGVIASNKRRARTR